MTQLIGRTTMKTLFASLVLFLMMTSVVFAQHGIFCSCSHCRSQAAFAERNINPTTVPPASGEVESVKKSVSGTPTSSVGANPQAVFVDFDSATAGADHVYTASERAQILDRMRIDYGRFDFTFTDTAPASGVFSTITINDGPSFGIAEDVDFRNLNFGDNATVDVNSGAFTSAQFVTLTANVASHELGHLVGLRHGDSFGPIGSGIDPNTVGTGAFRPTFPGPLGANETQFHLMESDGVFVENSVDQFFSERSAIRLEFNESGVVVGEMAGARDSLATAQVLSLGSLVVPNTIEVGARAGLGDFDVDAIAVVGSLDSFNEEDFYSFEAEAGDLFNFEVISTVPGRIFDNIDPQISILDSSGNLVDYFGQDAFNDDEFESLDSILIDLVLPETDTYFVRVNAFSVTDLGDYELFLHRFNGVAVAIPEPSAIALGLIAMGMATRRRRALCA